MPVYTVHAPVNSGADLSATDKFAFVRDGFHFWAALLSPVWLALASSVAGAARLDRRDSSRSNSAWRRLASAAVECSPLKC